MKKFLCYDTNDAASGKVNVSANGILKPNSTVPSTNGAPHQQLVTDGDGNAKWEDRLAYTGIGLTEWYDGTIQGTLTNSGKAYRYVEGNFTKFFTEGNKYTVIFNGVTYQCESKGPFEPYGRLGNTGLYGSGESTDEPFLLDVGIDSNLNILWDKSYGQTVTISVYHESEKTFPIDEKFIPVMSSVTLKSTTSGSSKKFKITVNDSGAITATEV